MLSIEPIGIETDYIIKYKKEVETSQSNLLELKLINRIRAWLYPSPLNRTYWNWNFCNVIFLNWQLPLSIEPIGIETEKPGEFPDKGFSLNRTYWNWNIGSIERKTQNQYLSIEPIGIETTYKLRATFVVFHSQSNLLELKPCPKML